MPKTFLKNFFYGLLVPFRAADLIFSHRSLFTLSILPVILSIITLFALVSLGILKLKLWIDALFSSWIQGNHGVILGIAMLIVSIGVIYFALQAEGMIASLLASPFNDLLAEKTEHVLKITGIPKRSLGYTLKIMLVDIRKTTFTLGMVIVLSVGLLLPGVNVAAFLALSLLNTFTFITYPQSRRAHGLRESWQWIQKNPGAALGFGIVMSLLLAAPVIDFFAIPVAVVGGTMLYFNR